MQYILLHYISYIYKKITNDSPGIKECIQRLIPKTIFTTKSIQTQINYTVNKVADKQI